MHVPRVYLLIGLAALVVLALVAGNWLLWNERPEDSAPSWEAISLDLPEGLRAVTYDEGTNTLWVLHRVSPASGPSIIASLSLESGEVHQQVLDPPQGEIAHPGNDIDIDVDGNIWIPWGSWVVKLDPAGATSAWPLPEPESMSRWTAGEDSHAIAVSAIGDDIHVAVHGRSVLYSMSRQGGPWTTTSLGKTSAWPETTIEADGEALILNVRLPTGHSTAWYHVLRVEPGSHEEPEAREGMHFAQGEWAPLTTIDRDGNVMTDEASELASVPPLSNEASAAAGAGGIVAIARLTRQSYGVDFVNTATGEVEFVALPGYQREFYVSEIHPSAWKEGETPEIITEGQFVEALLYDRDGNLVVVSRDAGSGQGDPRTEGFATVYILRK